MQININRNLPYYFLSKLVIQHSSVLISLSFHYSYSVYSTPILDPTVTGTSTPFTDGDSIIGIAVSLAVTLLILAIG